MRRFTLQTLREYDGLGGVPAYIAYRGQVYDVTGSFLWQGGRHQALHAAGHDLTGDLETAPHSEEMLLRCPKIGFLD